MEAEVFRGTTAVLLYYCIPHIYMYVAPDEMNDRWLVTRNVQGTHGKPVDGASDIRQGRMINYQRLRCHHIYRFVVKLMQPEPARTLRTA